MLGPTVEGWSRVLGPIFEGGSLRFDRYLSVELYVGTDISVCTGVLGQILVWGAVIWDRYLSEGQCVGTDNSM